jgi:hypothetical protein
MLSIAVGGAPGVRLPRCVYEESDGYPKNQNKGYL